MWGAYFIILPREMDCELTCGDSNYVTGTMASSDRPEESGYTPGKSARVERPILRRFS
jgi:hypothetical protein